MTAAISPVFCALDVKETARAKALAEALKGTVGGLKLGLEFFMAEGAAGYRAVAETGLPIFLDVKLHDIPNTVAGALRSLLPLKPAYITIHTSGGPAMLQAAVKAAAEAGEDRPKLLGVTVLTSLDASDLAAVGQAQDVTQQTLRLARLAQDSGLDGVICSPEEVQVLRDDCGPNFVLMVPGIRPAWASTNDQKRVMSPKEAMAAGATHLVIGRPITEAKDPAAAAHLIMDEIAK
jgi:orotidine-5'-phosphate decarboxylase